MSQNPLYTVSLVLMLSACTTFLQRPPPVQGGEQSTATPIEQNDQSAATTTVPNGMLSYEVSVVIDPSTRSLRAVVDVDHLPPNWGSTLYLNRGFQLSAVTSDGSAVPYQFDLEGEPPPYVAEARPLVLNLGERRRVRLKYSGTIPAFIFNVNTISMDLIELAIYAAWFPFSSEMLSFNYDLSITVPDGFIVVTNGEQTASRSMNGTTTTVWRSLAPSEDIAIVASPHLRWVEREVGSLRFEIFHSEASEPYVREQSQILTAALADFEARFGRTITERGVLRLVYSPRGGWDYSRIPLLVVSEESAIERFGAPFGAQSSAHGNAHELAHFWWGIADINTSADWVNEALAEYSALSFAVRAFGSDYFTYHIDRCEKSIRGAKTTDSILETTSSSPDRQVNWYTKSALILYALESRAGREAMSGVLRAFYQRFAGTRRAVPEDLISLIGQRLGSDSEAFVRHYLTISTWSDTDIAELRTALK